MLQPKRLHAVGSALALAAAVVALAAHAGSLSVTSPPTQVDLLELYTSEGCSSCPPADRWLSSLQQQPGLWRDFIPVAFHVDYWDYIGWPDRFASPAYTARQRTYAAQRAMPTIYTPGLFNNGREWRWYRTDPDGFGGGAAAGKLSLEVDGGNASVTYQADPGDRQLSVNVALLGFGIQTEVQAGENTGRTLTHDFVVLSFTQAPLDRSGDSHHGTVPLPQAGVPAERYALVAWVNASGNQDPLQAVGGWFEP